MFSPDLLWKSQLVLATAMTGIIWQVQLLTDHHHQLAAHISLERADRPAFQPRIILGPPSFTGFLLRDPQPWL